MIDDRERWNASWQERAEIGAPAPFVLAHQAVLPSTGRALDVAGGAGRHAVWLARRGLDVTVVDISDVGLARAAQHAADAGVPVRTVCADLDREPLPPGPWDLVLCIDFLDRGHRADLVAALAPGGVLVMAQPTELNLERHPRPSRRFLLDAGELETWARGAGLTIVVAEEGWNDEGRHVAAVIATCAGQRR